MLILTACQSADLSNKNTDSIFLQQDKVVLASPIIKTKTILFEDAQEVILEMNYPEVELYYTLDESSPSNESLKYLGPIVLKESATLKAKAIHPDLLESEISQKQFVKIGAELPIASINMNRVPNEKYSGLGGAGLVDRKKGTTNFKTEHWMGFDGGVLEVDIELKQASEIGKLTCSLLTDPAAWIFLPENIKVLLGTQKNELTEVQSKDLELTKEDESSELKFETLSFDPRLAKYIKVIIENHDSIPNWHPGKGNPPWLFIDEILFE